MKNSVLKLQLGKILYPVILILILLGLWSFAHMQGKPISEYGAVLQLVLSVVAIAGIAAGFVIDPYNQLCNEANFNAFGCSNPFGVSGWKTSVVHWTIIFLVYLYVTRTFPLKKSLVIFFLLSVGSLAIVYLVFLGALKYELCIQGG